MENTQAELESIKELSGAVKNGSEQKAMLMKKQVVDDVKRISDSYNKLDTQPVQSATMEFVPVEECKKSMPQFGHLSHDDVFPLNCELDLPQHVLQGKVEFKVVTKDQYTNQHYKGGSKVVIKAQSSRGDVTPVEVKDNKDGSYSASFVANHVGEVKLSVTIKEQQIKGSPFNVKVHGKYTTIDKPSKVVNEGGRMGQPWSIAFGKDGMWAAAVADESNHCVWVFDREDQLVGKFGDQEPDILNRPLGVAFDVNNHLYVTNYNDNRELKFECNGKRLLQFDSAQIYIPIGIAVHDDKVYVCCNGNCILVFNCDGQLLPIKIGPDHLTETYYIAISNDQVFIADYGQNCVVVFTLDGKYVSKYGTHDASRA